VTGSPQPWSSIGSHRSPLAYAPLHFLSPPDGPKNHGRYRFLLSSPIERQLENLTIHPSDYYSRTALGLMHLHHLGEADVCHNLITPLSWGEETPFGYGPSLVESTDPTVAALATYAHALVHRWEGHRRGEFGMVGYDNANFWGRATIARGDRGRRVPFAEVRSAVRDAAERSGDAALSWFDDWIVGDLGEERTGECWDPRALNELCRAVDGGGGGAAEYADLTDFCREACAAECDALIRRCLGEGGYEVPAADVGRCVAGGEVEKVDGDAGLRAGRRVSSAHLDKYNSCGCVTVRSVVGEDVASAAAGVAARLLECAACRRVDPDEMFGGGELAVAIYVHGKANRKGGGYMQKHDLSENDILAVQINEVVLPVDAVQEFRCTGWRIYAPCETDATDVVFVDRLFGTRGETPTTVIQWSKGTAFYSNSEEIPKSRSE